MSEKDFNILVNEDFVIVDFFATWCGPCKMLSPILDELKDRYKIVKVDVDENENIAFNSNIKVVPTLVIYKKGKVVDKISGYLNKEELENWIEKHK